MSAYLNRVNVLNLLESRRGLRTFQVFAREIGITPQLLTMVMQGERMPGKRILKFLGLEKITMYQEKQ